MGIEGAQSGAVVPISRQPAARRGRSCVGSSYDGGVKSYTPPSSHKASDNIGARAGQGRPAPRSGLALFQGDSNVSNAVSLQGGPWGAQLVFNPQDPDDPGHYTVSQEGDKIVVVEDAPPGGGFSLVPTNRWYFYAANVVGFQGVIPAYVTNFVPNFDQITPAYSY